MSLPGMSSLISGFQFGSRAGAEDATAGGLPLSQSNLGKGAIPKVGASLAKLDNEPEGLMFKTSSPVKTGESRPRNETEFGDGGKKTVLFTEHQMQTGDITTESVDLDEIREACKWVKSAVTRLRNFKGCEVAPVKKEVDALSQDLLQVLLPKSVDENVPHSKSKTDESVRKKIPQREKVYMFESSSSFVSDSDREMSRGTWKNKKIPSVLKEGDDEGKSKKSDLGKQKDPMSMDDLIRVLSRLDNRSVPRPEVYDLTSGRSFASFLQDFENFCSNSFRGDQAHWSSELGQFLSGEVKEAFGAIYFPGEPYGRLKSKLLNWVEHSMESLSKRNRKKFEKMKCTTGESLRLYAARLERAFVLAFPSKQPSTSSTLQRKFLETVPRNFRRQVTSTSTTLKLQNLKLDWNCILALASAHDAERAETGISVDSEAEVAEVWATTSASYAKEFEPRGRSVSPVVSHFSAGSFDFCGRSGDSQTDRPRSRSVQALERHQPSVFDARSCYYCKRKGHVKSECWRRSGRCLVCGSVSHRVAQCDKRHFLQSRQPNFKTSSSQQGSAQRFRRPILRWEQDASDSSRMQSGSHGNFRNRPRVNFRDQEDYSENFSAPRGMGTPRRS